MQEMLREYLMKGKVEKIQPLGSSWLGPHGLAASLPMPRIVNQGLARVYLRKDTAGPEVVTINLGRPEAFETKLETPGQLWRPSCLQSCDSTLEPRNVQNELGVPQLEHIPIQYVYEFSLLEYVRALFC